MPEKIDCTIEIIKNGENKVPAIILAVIDLMIVRSKKDGKFISKAKRIAIFPNPRRKNGTKRGKSISA